MSTLRKLQREVLRNQCYKKNGNMKSFNDEWSKLHYGKTEEVDEEGNVVAVKSKKVEKKVKKHYDDGRAYTKYLKAWKSMVDNMKTKSNAREKVC